MAKTYSQARRVVIGLGANLGDRKGQLQVALKGLEHLADGPVLPSSFWQSEGVGMADNSGGFINAVAAFDCSLEPLALLQSLQEIEMQMGRPVDHEKNVARPIDLDILLFGDEVFDLPDLKVPHPKMLERLFVLLPLQELLPDFVWGGVGLDEWIRRAPPIAINRQ